MNKQTEANNSQIEPLLKPQEVADLLRVSPRTLDKLIAMRKLIALRIGGQRRFTQKSIEAYIRDSHRRPR